MNEKPMKFDDEKPRMDLLPPNAIEELAKAMTYGAKKYGDDNYLNGEMLNPNRLVAAGLRHTFSYLKGNKINEESGLHHLSHALASFAMAIEILIRKKEL